MAPVYSIPGHELEDHGHSLLMVGMLIYRRQNRRKKRTHRWWVHEILQKRHEDGAYYRLVKDLQLHDDQFKRYFRLTREQFNQVLHHIEESLIKESRTREAICPRQRLAICLNRGIPIRVLSVCVKNRSLRDFTRTLTWILTRNGHMDGSQYISYVLHFSLTLSRTRTRTRTAHHVHMDGRLNSITHNKIHNNHEF